MNLSDLLTTLRTALQAHSGKGLLKIVEEHNGSTTFDGAWWAFGRDPLGQHCLYLALPLNEEQVADLRTEHILLSDRAYKEARPSEPEALH